MKVVFPEKRSYIKIIEFFKNGNPKWIGTGEEVEDGTLIDVSKSNYFSTCTHENGYDRFFYYKFDNNSFIEFHNKKDCYKHYTTLNKMLENYNKLFKLKKENEELFEEINTLIKEEHYGK